MQAESRRKKGGHRKDGGKAGSKQSATQQPRSEAQGRFTKSWESGTGPARGRGRGGGRGRGVQGRGQAMRPGSDRPRRPLSDLMDYLRTCTRTLGEGMASSEEEVLLATRAIEEMGERVLLVAADQRGSKVLEKLLRKADAEAFAMLFQRLAEAVPDLAPNQYASHVLQSAFASWAERLGATPAPPAAPFVSLCAKLSEESGWSALVHDPCASHVVRALVLALGGYAPGMQGRDRAAAKAGLLPEKRRDVPPEIAECRRGVAGSFVMLLSQDEDFCLNAHASPVVQLLLRVLRDRGDRVLVGEIASAVVGSGATGAPSVARCDALLRSAPGSRTLEAVLETSSAERFGALFIRYFRPRLRGLVKGEHGDFGAFLAQRVADGLRDEPQLSLALSEVDFAECLKGSAAPALQAVAVKFVEACLRLRAGLKQCATEVFRALELRASDQQHRAWATMLALEPTDSPEALLRAAGHKKGKTQHDAEGGSGDKAADIDKEEPRSLRSLPAAGSQLLSSLLRFPAEAVQPLNAGLPRFLENRTVLHALARESKTARVIETALAQSSALVPKLRLRLARAFIGALGTLGPHPVGGWVCAALWRASLGQSQLREKFAQELLAVEDALRAHNFAVWKVCGLHQAKTRQEEWLQQQQKAGKAKRFFDEITEGGDAEAAKAVARARAQAAEDEADRQAARQKAMISADPVIAGLMPAKMDELDATKKIAEPADIAGPETDGADAAEDDEMDELFSTHGKRRGKARKSASEDTNGVNGSVSLSSSNAQVGTKTTDSALREALELIAGRAPARLKKKRKREAAAAAEESSTDEEEKDAADQSLASQPQIQPGTTSAAVKKAPRKKRKRSHATQ